MDAVMWYQCSEPGCGWTGPSHEIDLSRTHLLFEDEIGWCPRCQHALRSETQGEVCREVDDLLARLERFEYDAAGESEEYWRVVAMRDRIAAARTNGGRAHER